MKVNYVSDRDRSIMTFAKYDARLIGGYGAWPLYAAVQARTCPAIGTPTLEVERPRCDAPQTYT